MKRDELIRSDEETRLRLAPQRERAIRENATFLLRPDGSITPIPPGILRRIDDVIEDKA